jgi:hypothetical protein
MFSISRRLLVAAGIGLLLTIWFLFVRHDPDAPLRPALSPQQAVQTAMQALQSLQIPSGSLGQWQVTQEENSTAEQFLAQKKGLADFTTRFSTTKPLVYWKVVSTNHKNSEIWVNQQTGRVEAMRGMTFGADNSYLKKQFLSELAPITTSPLGKSKVLTTYRLDGGYMGLQDVLEIETIDGKCTGFTHRQVVPQTFVEARGTGPWMETVAGFFNLLMVLIFPLIGLYVFLFRGKQLVGMRWLTPIVAGTLTVLAICVQEGFAQGFGDGLLYGLSVVVVMQIVYRGQLDRQLRFLNSNWTLQKVVLGYCLFGIQAGVSVLFAWVAEQCGGWMSEAQGQELIALSHFPLLLPLATGVAGAIFEELVYRKWADVWLRRLARSTWLTGLLSSVLWSLGHLGYDVAPWYLRIIELGLVMGPLSFWMYRTYGLFSLILAHFLYNLFVTCHDLVSYFGQGYAAVYLYLLLPLGLLLVPRMRNPRLIG